MSNISLKFTLSEVAINFSCMSQWVAKLFIGNDIKLSTPEVVFPSSETLNFTIQGYWPERSWEEALSMTTPCQWLTLLLCHPNDRRYSAVFRQSHMTGTAGTRTVCDYSPHTHTKKRNKNVRSGFGKCKCGTSTEYVRCVNVLQREQVRCCTSHQILFRWSHQEENGGRGM